MRHRWRKAVGYAVCVALLWVGGASSASAATITLGAEADTQVSDGNPYQNYNRGGEGTIYIGDAGAFFKAMARFDISGVPAGQIITSATLKLTIVDGAQVAGDVHRIDASWIEGSKSLNDQSPPIDGVTWHSRGPALPNWEVAGLNGPTDRNPAASASFTAADVTASVLSINLTGDVQSWYGGTQPNHGWVLVRTAAAGYTGYYARETSAALGPQLTITYEPVPEPASIALLGGAVLLLARRNRAIR